MQGFSRAQGWFLGGGRAATCCADQILEITLIWLVWQATQSSTLTGLAAFTQRAPFWILGFAGAGYVDRVGAARMLYVLNVLAALSSLGGMFVAWAFELPDQGTALLIASTSFMIGVLRSMEAPALTALVPSFGETWNTQTLNNLLDNAKRVGRLTAPLPTLMLGLVPAPIMLGLCALGYLTMSGIAHALGDKKSPQDTSRLRTPVTDGAGGTGLVQTLRGIYGAGQMGLVLSVSAAYAVCHGAAYFSIMPRVLLSSNAGEVGAYASIISAFPFGAIVSNLIIARIRVTRFVAVVALGMLVVGLAFALIGQVEGMMQLWLVGFAGGMALPFQDVFITCLIQRDAPRVFLARSHALWRLGCEAGLGIGMLVGGFVADHVDGAMLLIGIGLLIGVATGVLLANDLKHERQRAR